MAFCQNCGAQLNDGVKFCPACGAPVVPKAPTEPQPPQAPAQPAYVPPVQQPAETPPAQQQAAYAPPAQQQPAYTPPAAPPPAPPAAAAPPAAGGKRFNLLPFLIGLAADVVLCVLIVVFALTLGKKAVSGDPNVGTWTAAKAEMMGMEMDIDELYDGGFIIELKDRGKCVIEIGGETANGKWTLEDGDFHAEGGGVELDGKIDGGVMTLEDVQGMGVTITLYKDSYAAPSDAGGTMAASSGDAGRYILTAMSSDGIDFTQDDLSSMGMGSDYLLLNDGGTGELCLNGAVTQITWGDGTITYGMPYTYERTGDTLVYHMGANDFTYTLESAMGQAPETASESAETAEPAEFVSPTTSLSDDMELYGLMIASNFSGATYDDRESDMWGYIHSDGSGNTFLELYDAEDYGSSDDSPVLSYWVKVSGDELEADIENDGSCWLYDMDLIPDDAAGLSGYLDNGMLTLSCRYVTDEYSCDMTFYLRELGTPWDEANDPLPDSYGDYKAKYGFDTAASSASSSGTQASGLPDGEGILPAEQLQLCYTAMHALGTDIKTWTYDQVIAAYLNSVDGKLDASGTNDSGAAYARYVWTAQEDSTKLLCINFEDPDGDGVYTCSGNYNTCNLDN